MRVALVGAELEENLALRYMAAALEQQGHSVDILPFASEADVAEVVRRVEDFRPEVTGLSMVFTSRAREFCRLASALRERGYRGHIIAGGPFASFNCETLLREYPAFDSVALGEGEWLMCRLAECPEELSRVPGLCYRQPDGSIVTNPARVYADDLDELPFPKRTGFHEYYGKPIASVLTSRGCWRDCAFCSINAWYQRVGGRRFRVRSVGNIVEELADLYHSHGVRIFNFQDDNFFLPNPRAAVERFEGLREGLRREGVVSIAIAVKARPDSITREAIAVLDDLGLFRVFLGVENASENGLRNLNRKSKVEEILSALEILNDYDVHVAYNLLMFEPDTTMDDILVNLRFMERHIDNPQNFCRAEAYPGTGLETKLKAEGRLLGDGFGLDYRLRDPACEAFHRIANYAFFDRNFSDFGLHYFNMEVDFHFQLLRRFRPEALTQSLRSAVRSFVKQTNLDTHQWLCRIYDFLQTADPLDQVAIQTFARQTRACVDLRSTELRTEGERLLAWLDEAQRQPTDGPAPAEPRLPDIPFSPVGDPAMPYLGLDRPQGPSTPRPGLGAALDSLGVGAAPIPYDRFRRKLAHQDSLEG